MKEKNYNCHKNVHLNKHFVCVIVTMKDLLIKEDRWINYYQQLKIIYVFSYYIVTWLF